MPLSLILADDGDTGIQQEKYMTLAIEDAVRRGAQIINLSLGDMLGDPYSPECAAANNAMLSGCVVCAAAGNAGPTPSSVGSPGAAHHVITMPWSH